MIARAMSRTLRNILLLSLALALLAPCVRVAVPLVHDQLRPRRFVEVQPGLFRSAQIAPRLVQGVLERHRIRKIVWMLHYDEAKASHRAERRAAEALGVEIVNLHLRGDGRGKVGHYVQAIAEVAETRRAGGAVLVQCASGSRRSAAVVALYLLLVEGRPASEVYAELDRFGSPVAETPLLPYVNLHLREIAEGLAARDVIDRVPEPLPLLVPPAPSAGRVRSLPFAQAQLETW
jgi:hypothetical protein